MNLSDQQIASIPATYFTNNTLSQSSNGPSSGRKPYEAAYVRSLFNNIARRYDLLNHILSSGFDIVWRRRALRLLEPHRPKKILDVATGTGDFAIEAARLQADEIVGVDVASEMLRLGKKKITDRGLERIIKLEEGAAEHLRFRSDSFDAVTVAFGVRNFTDLKQGLSEIHRVLKPMGAVLILEFSRPKSFPVRQIYRLYSENVLPLLGGWISNHREAYEYLPNTIRLFPDREDFSTLLRSIGFQNVQQMPMTFGIVTVYHAIKHSLP